MKVIVPEHIGDITLNQFQRYDILLKREDLDEYHFAKRKLSIFLNVPYNHLDKISMPDWDMLLKDIDKALSTQHEFKQRFFIKDVEFGFIPNFDKMTVKEFCDLSLYPADKVETYHNLMAILFRPITNKDSFKNYTIAEYNGTSEWAEVMKQMPISVVDGAMVFFCNLARELRISMEKYMAEALLKEDTRQNTLKNGVGIAQ